MVTTMASFCARRSPQYKAIEADPLMYPPPYIQTITGRCSCAVLAGVQMLGRGNLRSLLEAFRPASTRLPACTPEQTHLPYVCRSRVLHVPEGANASRPPGERRMEFLCRHSTRLRVSPIWFRTPSGLAARQRH